MKELTREQQLLLLRIEKARIILSGELERESVTSEEIIRSFGKKDNYRLKYTHKYRENILRDINNCPFLLCDQDYLNLNIKKMLPSILKVRFDMEIDELCALYEKGDITDDELLERKEMLKFCYYESSKEGKQILKNGKVKSVVNNKIRSV